MTFLNDHHILKLPLRFLKSQALKWQITVLFFCLNFVVANATHIVGGNFQVRDLGFNRLEINLIIYFDNINGNPGAVDPSVLVGIWDKSNNTLVNTFQLPVVPGVEFVDATFPQCVNPRLVTRILRYRSVVDVDPRVFDNPVGYYLSWERCCRNNAITNIVNPGATGQTFYAELPPMWRSGFRFSNSTPEFAPIINDYACVGRTFEFNFNATDPDGDQLVYSLVDPLAGNSRNTGTLISPPPLPGPYAPVAWNAGYNSNAQIVGNEILNVSQAGLLRFNSNRTGLHVFSVRVEEFRNGQKIGEVRREYQVLVIDCTPEPSPRLSVPVANFNSGDTLFFRSNTGISQSIRFGIDGGANSNEQICISARAINFAGVGPLFAGRVCGNVSRTAPEGQVQIYIPNCVFSTRERPLQVMVTASKDACPQPIKDSILVNIVVEPEPLLKPFLRVNNYARTIKADTIEAAFGENISLNLGARGMANKQLTLKYDVFGFGGGDSISGRDTLSLIRNYTVPCFIGAVEPRIRVIARLQECGFVQADTFLLFLKIKVQPFNSPTISSTVTAPSVGIKRDTVSVKVGDQFNFRVTGLDTNKRTLLLTGAGRNFIEQRFNTNFLRLTSQTGTVQANFTFQPTCEYLTRESPVVKYIVRNTACDTAGFDSLEVVFRVIPPDSAQPELTLTVNANRPQEGQLFRLQPNQVLDLRVLGISSNNLATTVRLVFSDFPNPSRNQISESATGNGRAELNFPFVANCADIGPAPNQQGKVTVLIANQLCGKTLVDTTFIFITVSDDNKPSTLFTDLPNEQFNKRISRRLFIGERLDFNLIAEDLDTNNIQIVLKPTTFPLIENGIQFSNTFGKGRIVAPFVFQSSCTNVGRATEAVFNFKFYALDSVCASGFKDSVELQVVVFDSATRDFLPPNIITPNGDNFNDVWELTKFLPPDNCQDAFDKIEIFNRWGARVFLDRRRDFVWDANGLPTGEYFYIIKYLRRSYKGWVTVAK